ncbi:3-oxoacyl-ACP synthase [Streptomyces sp. RB6PN25]|uniref:3-oxoacyl-ACP synthase n=1 Tax=Streptomyces humicola TaxID=2953240 RepID=A0ABT1PTE3_9ACTN|nr:beta-ketoacyl synthase N-terminal-like domain-containing protein [Streptomyces humicola]MCQ4080921.1 3-oxoacyl-ACP synthase [Streptomyces humicola]
MSWDITGIGAVSALGSNPYEIFDGLCAGCSGLGPLRAFDAAKYRARCAYEIDDRAGPEPDEPFRASRWLRAAVGQALADAGLEGIGSRPVLVGTTLREQRSAELWWRQGTEFSSCDLHFGPTLRNEFGTPYSYTFANACAAALYALGMATDMIELGQADTVVVAGTDSITESAFGSLDRVQNRTPEALRPFDRERSGMLMGEGAVAAVVQRSGTATAGRVHAVVRGVSMSCDAHHPTAPDPEGIVWAVQDAYRRAGVTARDIDLVMLHGSGTQLNDEVEAAAMCQVLGDAVEGPLLTAIKSMTGHTLGGSGLLSLVMAALSLQKGVVAPVLGLNDPIEQARSLRLVRGMAATADLAVAQVNAFGFGGINAVAVLEKGA